jgi:hypothetical protein
MSGGCDPDHMDCYSSGGSPSDSGDDTGSYYVDGLQASASTVNALQNMGAGVQCPNDVCSGFSNDGQYGQFFAFEGGTQGYFDPSDLNDGINALGGHLYSNSQLRSLIDNAVEVQKEALADKISLASDSPDGSDWDKIYEGLHAVTDPIGNYVIHGSNAVFSWVGDQDLLPFVSQVAWDKGGCLFSCRYGSLDQIHYHNDDFHLDTIGANWGFGLGLILHGIIDYGFGNINPGIPRNP